MVEPPPATDTRSALRLSKRSHTAWRRWADAFVAPERRFELVGVMTLLLLLLYSEPIWYLELGVYGLGLAALLYRPLLSKPALWFLLTAFLAVGHIRAWFYIDNHKYLITYWCLAVALALLAREPLDVLRVNARLLIGLAFLLAVVAKLVSPDYLDGSFFEGLLLSDRRFFGVSTLLGGVPPEALRASELTRMDALALGDVRLPVAMPSTARLVWIAQVLTWWTILIEAAVAVLFLWPEDRGPSRWRDPTLLAFIITTYPVAPVIGFAWVLTTMGVAQSSRRGYRYWPVFYAASFLLVMLVSYVPATRFLTL